MIPQGYVQALVSRAERKGAAGIQELKELADSLFDLISGNKGKDLVAHSINGKSYGWAVNMTNQEALSAVEQALRELADDGTGSTPATYADFRCLDR